MASNTSKTNGRPDHNSYWKMPFKIPFRHDLNFKKVKEELNQRNYSIFKSASKEKLLDALQRSDRGLLSHGQKTNSELRDQIEKPGIDTRKVIVGNRKGTRDELINLLASEDDNQKFHRFQDLPAELRNKIYEYHFADFHQPIYALIQPPITRISSGIRAETLGLFYHNCTFDSPLARIYKGATEAGPARYRLNTRE